MTSIQKAIKYIAIAFAILLTVSIIGGILGAVGTVGFLFDIGETPIGEMKTYEISENITELDIDIGAADFRVIEGESVSVKTNNKNITVKEHDGKLIISEKGRVLGYDYSSGELVVDLYFPKGIVFDKVDITTGAGVVSIYTLTASDLSLELGAGKAEIATLVATKRADIDGGAGQIIISGGELCNLDLDMGIGELSLTSVITGKSEIDCGIGEVNITLLGGSDDYRIDVEKGLGDIRVDGKSFSGIYGDGNNKIDIDGGVGRINIKFEEK